jgi:uroporphyrinogen decarboxylase
MHKKDALLSLANREAGSDYVPAAFFLHFDPEYHTGQAAIDKHLEFFRYTGMDFVKIQYEQKPPPVEIRKPQDWVKAPRLTQDFFEPTLQVVKGLVEAIGDEALVVVTLYSPLMWAGHLSGKDVLAAHLRENPEAVKKGLEILTENVQTLARGCIRAGVDGFYASTQGGETHRFGGTPLFRDYIKPTDLAVWDVLEDCTFNILHICDYEGGYTDLAPFVTYPGNVVNASLRLGEQELTLDEAAKMFDRPFMGGMERTGVIATGTPDQIRALVDKILDAAPEHFILGADCTVPGDTPWENLKTAIDTAHRRPRLAGG